MPVEQPTEFTHVDMVTHDSIVVAFGEEWSQDGPRRLWYRVLDLQQTADEQAPGAWEDATRWTRWYEVPFPPELRPVGLSLLTVTRTIDHSHASVAGRWNVLTDGKHLYVFRALDLVGDPDAPEIRVYTNRYKLLRMPSPDAGQNKAASGQEVSVPQLLPVREARYRRSSMRETPASDTDAQGTRTLGNRAFDEPTMEWSMLRPIDGGFAVAITPSDIPDRDRWQFFGAWEQTDPDTSEITPAMATWSFLRDEDGWADLEEKFDLLNTVEGPFTILPDHEVPLAHDSGATLRPLGKPTAITYRLQEAGSALDGTQSQSLSSERVLLAWRVADTVVSVADDGTETTEERRRLATMDFALDSSGAIDVSTPLELSDVDFARQAVWLNSSDDRVTLTDPGAQSTKAFTAQAWVRHDEGNGSVLCRGWAPGTDPSTVVGWSIEWRGDLHALVARRTVNTAAGLETFEIQAPLPTSYTWHHVALVVDDANTMLLYVDAALVGSTPMETGTSYAITGDIYVGGPAFGTGANWLDLRVDQVIAWTSAQVPTLETIYVELDDTARAAAHGYWDLDVDPDGTIEGSPFELVGADAVSQTAPLFPPEKAEFEKFLGGMSTSMGVLAPPGFDLLGDANLFIGADGIVRLYVVAQEAGDETAELELGSLVFDTTTTRTQFTLPWEAVAGTSTRTGELVLQARLAGPVMNRARLELTEMGEFLELRITHPHRDDLAETWLQLPRDLVEFVAVLNGRATMDDEDEAYLSGDVPYYNYDASGPKTGGPYPSDLVQADVAAAPDNGADPVVRAPVDTTGATTTAPMRQQGNFTGWTRAPLAVSGRFGEVTETIHRSDGFSTEVGTGEYLAASCSLDPADDLLENLRIPADFAYEFWLAPMEAEGRSVVFNWLQGDDDGTSLQVSGQRAFGFSETLTTLTLSPDPSLTPMPTRSWFTDNAGLGLRAIVQLPFGGGEGGLETVLTQRTELEGSITMGDVIDRIVSLETMATPRNLSTAQLNTWILDANADWATFIDAVTVEIVVEARLGMRGSRLLFEMYHQILLDTDATAATAAIASATSWIAMYEAMVTGEAFHPMGGPSGWQLTDTEATTALEASTSLLNQTLTQSEGDEVAIAISAQTSTDSDLFVGLAGVSTVTGNLYGYVDNEQVTSLDASTAQMRWLAPATGNVHGALTLGGLQDGTPPFGGILRLAQFWQRTPTTSAIWSTSTADISCDLDSPQEDTSSFLVTVVDQHQPNHQVSVPKDNYYAAFYLEPTLGKRQYQSTRTFSAADWLHVGVVCSDNFAVRFEEDGDRAVISDADGLNPDRGLTIDCTIVHDGTSSTRTILSKAVEIGDRTLSFRLYLDSNHIARLRYRVNVEGTEQEREVKCSDALTANRAYHLVCGVSLEEVYDPEETDTSDSPATRYQVWCAHDGVWAFDIHANAWHGATPRDLNHGEVRALPMVYLRVYGQDLGEMLAITYFGSEESYGVLSATTDYKPEQDVQMVSTSVAAAIGCATGEDTAEIDPGRQNWYRGLIGSVRVWRQWIPAADMKRVVTEPGLPSGVPTPTAWWQFSENKGLEAEDGAGGMTALLTRETMWEITRTTAHLGLYVNGRSVGLKLLGESNVDYGPAATLTLGGRLDSTGTPTNSFSGALDEVRIWSDVRTTEEMLDNMHARLGGVENDLAAWWPMSAGIGSRIKDGSGGGNHLNLSLTTTEGAEQFWLRRAAPVADDAPVVRHLLGGAKTSWSAAGVTGAAAAAEYGDMQTDADGNLKGVQKRATVFSQATGGDEGEEDTGWRTRTGYKTGDIDLIYIGQAQSDPTLIGYIEGAPPVPSENLTMPHWTSPIAYNNYVNTSTVTLTEAQNTVTTFSADYDRGFDMVVNAGITAGFSFGATVGTGVAFGGFADLELEMAKFSLDVGAKATFEHTLGWSKSYETAISTSRTLSNTLGMGGTWERGTPAFTERRYLPDNVGYALVKSGVANVYAMRLAKNGAMLGITMAPDPDIPEDFNILTFKISNTYTKQGTLDGMIGFAQDESWKGTEPGKGSYFRPREVANLEAQIEAYEAKLDANYADFDAGALGRRQAGTHFTDDDPASDPENVVRSNIVEPYNWDDDISERNIVNTYVWTASGGFFAETVKTSITRTESLGGNYSFKGMAGPTVKLVGRFAASITFDLEALFGGHIETKVTKVKEEGREFGLDITCDTEGFLETYTPTGEMLYDGQAAPGKVLGYRFKSFYLVPSKKHFDHFWSSVIDQDWLDTSSDADARSLRQARANLNIVWRVFHRVTYVNRVPGGDLPAPLPATRSVVHEVPNWMNIDLVIDVLRIGQTSQGEDVTGLGIYEQLAVAVDDLLRHPWADNAPWWAATVAAFDADPESDEGQVFRELRTATYEYMRAYYDSGLLTANPRYTDGPDGPDAEEPDPPVVPVLPPLTSMGEAAEDALHYFPLDSRSKTYDSNGGDEITYTWPATLAHDELPPGTNGRLTLPAITGTDAAGAGRIAPSGDWGRVADRTWELVFRPTREGQAVLLACDPEQQLDQMPFRSLTLGNERRDGQLAIWLPDQEHSVSLPGVTTMSTGKLVYVAIQFTASVPSTASDVADIPAKVEVVYAIEGGVGLKRVTVDGAKDGAHTGVYLHLGGSGQTQFNYEFATGDVEIYHLACYDLVLSAAEIQRRLDLLEI